MYLNLSEIAYSFKFVKMFMYGIIYVHGINHIFTNINQFVFFSRASWRSLTRSCLTVVRGFPARCLRLSSRRGVWRAVTYYSLPRLSYPRPSPPYSPPSYSLSAAM